MNDTPFQLPVIWPSPHDAGAAERLGELLQVSPDIRSPADPVPLPVPPRGEIGFKNVRFAYPDRAGATVNFAISSASPSRFV